MSFIFNTLTILISVLIAFTWGQNENDFLYGKFPSDFLWGFATASYQIEGGWQEQGKINFKIS